MGLLSSVIVDTGHTILMGKYIKSLFTRKGAGSMDALRGKTYSRQLLEIGYL